MSLIRRNPRTSNNSKGQGIGSVWQGRQRDAQRTARPQVKERSDAIPGPKRLGNRKTVYYLFFYYAARNN